MNHWAIEVDKDFNLSTGQRPPQFFAIIFALYHCGSKLDEAAQIITLPSAVSLDIGGCLLRPTRNYSGSSIQSVYAFSFGGRVVTGNSILFLVQYGTICNLRIVALNARTVPARTNLSCFWRAMN